ncbi:hypothetical protein OPV22_010325 [Ensete ventricosum]|uniref:Protein FATTY ACID EXPORT 3, chloroplastic n=1 Tax=Ensete ventricosum TaxID=4639 RepID=A0AAV8RI09_ENSVE|nr:hypothetical protein OPV22_010325 [Ensete ventricosum]
MAAASLDSSLLMGNLGPKLCGNRAPKASRLPFLSSSHCPSEGIRCPLGLAHSSPLKSSLGPHRRIIPFAASPEESNPRDIEVEKDTRKDEIEAGVSQEAWHMLLEIFKTEAHRVRAMSQAAYKVFSNKAIEVLMETSERLKIQSDIAQHDLNIVAKEISEEGKGYLSAAAKNSPDFIKDIVEAYESKDELKSMSAVRDFYLGIPYGAFLSLGGFLHFMLTGSIPAIRFGIILGTSILVLSISSLRSWKSGKATLLLLKSQTAIAAIIFLRHWRLWSQRGSFLNLLMLLISGAMEKDPSGVSEGWLRWHPPTLSQKFWTGQTSFYLTIGQ